MDENELKVSLMFVVSSTFGFMTNGVDVSWVARKSFIWTVGINT